MSHTPGPWTVGVGDNYYIESEAIPDEQFRRRTRNTSGCNLWLS